MKGWKRINAALFILVAAMEKDVFSEMTSEPMMLSLGSVHCILKEVCNMEAVVFLNRTVGQGKGHQKSHLCCLIPGLRLAVVASSKRWFAKSVPSPIVRCYSKKGSAYRL